MTGDDVPVDLTELEHLVGHYLVAVADEVMKDGVVIARFRADVYDAEEVECEAGLAPPPDYAPRCGLSGAQDLSLDWDSISGWSIYVELETADQQYATVTRWMGGGLVPAPDRVAGFLATGLVDIAQAGAEDQPFYRNRGEDLDELMDRLRPYVPDSEKAPYFPQPRHRFNQARAKWATQLAVEDITSTEKLGLLPVREGELLALCRLLDWHDAEHSDPLRRLLVALAKDLMGRYHGDTTTTPNDLAAAVHLHSKAIEEARQTDTQ